MQLTFSITLSPPWIMDKGKDFLLPSGSIACCPMSLILVLRKCDALCAISLTSNIRKHRHNNQSELTEECDRRLLFHIFIVRRPKSDRYGSI